MPDERQKPNIASRLIVGLIRGYQLTVSSLMGRTCRHLPTCSEYTTDAVLRFGAWRGGWLGLSRILRCNPWGTQGFDPVPEDLPDHGWKFWRYGRWTQTNKQ